MTTTDAIEEAVDRERARVLSILESHRSWIGEMGYFRITNLINSEFSFEDEMKLPIEERAFGFHWPDAQPAKRKKKRADKTDK